MKNKISKLTAVSLTVLVGTLATTSCAKTQENASTPAELSHIVGNNPNALPPVMANLDVPDPSKKVIELTKGKKIIVLYSKDKNSEFAWKLKQSTPGVTFTPAKKHSTWVAHPAVNIGKNTKGYFTLINDKKVEKTFKFICK